MSYTFRKIHLKDLPPPPEGKTGWPWTEQSEALNERMSDSSGWPRISIVTPSYNQGQFIEETIRSVLLQAYPNWEYIIIDGGSTDNTLEIIKKYEPWVNYWISEPDRGQSHAINKGVEVATGEIFNWLNSDDYYDPDALFYIAKSFLDSEVDIVGGKERRFGKDLDPFIHNGTVFFDNLAHSVYQGFNVQPCTFFKLEFIKRTGFLNEDFHYFMDSELYIRYMLLNGHAKIKKIDHLISNFRLHSHSKTFQDSNHHNLRFSTEAWSLRYSIANQLGMDTKVLLITKQIFNLINHDNWCIKQDVDVDFYFYHYLVDLIEILLNQKLGKEARYCFFKLIQLRRFKWAPGFVLILFETFFPSISIRKNFKSITNQLRTILPFKQTSTFQA